MTYYYVIQMFARPTNLTTNITFQIFGQTIKAKIETRRNKEQILGFNS